MQRGLPALVFIIWIAALPAAAQDKRAGKPPVLRRGAAQGAPASPNAASQLAASLDAGDRYPTPDGPRKLLRLAGAVAVSADCESPLFGEQLLAADKPLSGYKVSGRPAHGVTVLLAPAAAKSSQLKAPAVLDGLLQSVRATAAGQSANPVFVDPASGLRLLATTELIVCLKPGTDAQAYFGAQWKDTRPLWGTTDQFILTLTNATAEEVFAAVSRQAAQSQVAWAEPNFIMQAAKSFVPDDNFFSDQWHLLNTGQSGGASGADVRATDAWDISQGSPNVVIAIIDDGVQLDHPDLAANIFINAGEIAGNGVDDDGNGFIDDVRGWDFYFNDNDPGPADPLDNHGTALAGVAAAVGNNGLGISGAAPRCKILPLKIITGEGEDAGIPVTEVSRVLRYAAGLNSVGQQVWRGADVMNLSLGFPRMSAVDAALTAAATLGRSGRGCAIFCASGNSAAAWVPYELEFVAQGTYTLRWEFTKDENDIYSKGADTVWLDSIVFPGGVVESFEGGVLPPGWTTGGAARWHVVTNGVGGNRALTGRTGPASRSLRAGRISHDQATFVEVTGNIERGSLRFWAWTEGEAASFDGIFVPFDKFHFYVDGEEWFTDSGVPVLASGVTYPASHPVTFAVGASTDFDFRADYSQFGADLDFVAPSDGGNASIPTTDRTGPNGYNPANGIDGDYSHDFGGTSASTPLASGIAALALSVNPYLSLADLRALLRGTCDRIGNVTYDANDFNPAYGYGRLNAERAVKHARPNLIVIAAATPNAVVVGDITTYAISVRNNGSSLSGPVSLTNRLPANVNLGPVTPAPSARVGNELIFNTDNMASGALRTYRIIVTNTVAGDNVNIASVGNDVQESELADNSVTNLTTVGPVPFVSIHRDVTVLEADTTATNAVFQVTLSNPSSRTVTVRYTTGSNTALSGRDFAGASGLLTFLPGQTMKTITVRVLPDRLNENDETFLVNLNTPVNVIIAEERGVGLILDNDPLPALSVGNVLRTEGDTASGAAVFKVRLIPASGRPVTVQFGTASGSAIDGVDFIGTNGTLTFLPGKTVLTIPVRVFGERSRETNEMFSLDLNNPTFATISNSHAVCTIVNNDALPKLFISDASVAEGDGGTTNAVFNVRLAPASGIPAQVNFFSTNGSAGGLDFTPTNGVLVFAPGETNKVISVSVLGDTLSESNEVFSIRVVAPTNATLGDALGLGAILDDDPLPTLSISDASAVQTLTSTTSAVFTAALSTVSGRTVTARYATSNGTAVASADYVARSGTLTFRPGTTSLMVTAVVQRAAAGEIDESFFVNLSAPVNATLADGQGVGMILAVAPAARALLRIVEARFERGALCLRFISQPGLRYCVERCEAPGGSGAWKPVSGAGEIEGTGAVIEALDLGASAAQCGFYRIRVLE